MTALDRAFTKVYQQQTAVGRPTIAATAQPMPAAQPRTPAAARTDAPQVMPQATRATATPATLPRAKVAAEPLPEKLPAVGLHCKSAAANIAPPSCSTPTLPSIRLLPPTKPKPAPTIDELDLSGCVCQAVVETPVAAPDAAPEAASAAPQVLAPEAAPRSLAAAVPLPARAKPSEASPAPQTILRILRPATRIASFAWPRICNRLLATAGEQFTQLADVLLAAKGRGQKVVAISGCQRGEGASSVLLATARQVAERGQRVAVIDADWDHPQLGAILGLKVAAGWQGMLSGAMTLADAVIESADTKMAILPQKASADGSVKPWEQVLGVAETIETIAQNYDLVLVDTGPIFADESSNELAWRGLDGCLDAAIVVQKTDDPPGWPAEVVENVLTGAGIAALGIVENFVRD